MTTGIQRPYTRTHTIRLSGCENLRALRSPKSARGRRRLIHRLVNALESCGFTVTRSSKRQLPDAACRPFGNDYGFTKTAILSESHFAIHTYPEEKFCRCAEIEFNLCYLTKDHLPAIRKAVAVFAKYFKPERVREWHSRKRYFDE